MNLNKGYVLVYDINNIKLHNYNTNDAIVDQVIILEKNNKLAIIESPAFYDNKKELEQYINLLNAKIDGVLLSYHMGGGTFLKNSKKYATHKADEYGYHSGEKDLIDNFTKVFRTPFDKNIYKITDYIAEGSITLADIKLNIIPIMPIECPEGKLYPFSLIRGFSVGLGL